MMFSKWEFIPNRINFEVERKQDFEYFFEFN